MLVVHRWWMNGKRHFLLIALRTPQSLHHINQPCVPTGDIGERLWDRLSGMAALALQKDRVLAKVVT
jgi:hypothetical protein